MRIAGAAQIGLRTLPRWSSAARDADASGRGLEWHVLGNLTCHILDQRGHLEEDTPTDRAGEAVRVEIDNLDFVNIVDQRPPIGEIGVLPGAWLGGFRSRYDEVSPRRRLDWRINAAPSCASNAAPITVTASARAQLRRLARTVNA